MESKSAIKSKTINFNVIILGVIAALAAFDIDVSSKVYQALLALVPMLNILLRFITKGAITLTAKSDPSDQSGHTQLSVMAVLLALCIGWMGLAFIGCTANQTATAQIVKQTNDPGTIALATFADAQDAYIEAAQLYIHYKAITQERHPELDAKIVEYFSQANQILAEWESMGDVPLDDKTAFREYLRKISIEAAKAIESGE